MLLIFFFILFGLAVLTLWLFILMDCINGEFNGNDKIVWVLMITLLPVVGSLCYLIFGKDQKIDSSSPWNTLTD